MRNQRAPQTSDGSQIDANGDDELFGRPGILFKFKSLSGSPSHRSHHLESRPKTHPPTIDIQLAPATSTRHKHVDQGDNSPRKNR